jgi:hypothetical protein
MLVLIFGSKLKVYAWTTFMKNELDDDAWISSIMDKIWMIMDGFHSSMTNSGEWNIIFYYENCDICLITYVM